MPLDPRYLDAIKGFEGFAPAASWDYKQHSVGYGTKARFPGERIDRAEAERRYLAEMTDAAGHVDAAFPGLTPGRRAALASLTFNAGPGWINSGLGDAVRNNKWDEAHQRFLAYNKAGGAYNEGLASRRAQEAAWLDGADPVATPRGRTPMADMYAGMDPALSPGFQMGSPGALFSPQGYDLGNRLQKAAAFAMSLDNPQALGALGALNKEGEFGVVQGADGTMYRVNKRNGQVMPVAQGSRPEKYSVHTGPNGEMVRLAERSGEVLPLRPGIDPATKLYNAERAKAQSKMEDEVDVAAEKARNKLTDLGQLQELAKNGGIWQGTGAEAVAALRKFGATFGIGVEGSANTEAFRSLVNQFALELRNPHAGAGMPGALSDRDLAFLKESAPSLSRTQEGNLKLIDYMGRVQNRVLEVQARAQAYKAAHGRLDDGWKRELREYVTSNPLFKEGETVRGPSADRPPLNTLLTIN